MRRLRTAFAVLRGRPVAYRLTFDAPPAWNCGHGHIAECTFTPLP